MERVGRRNTIGKNETYFLATTKGTAALTRRLAREKKLTLTDTTYRLLTIALAVVNGIPPPEFDDL